MKIPDAKPTFTAAGATVYDSETGHSIKETAFDEREKLLFANTTRSPAKKPLVGIPGRWDI